MSVLEKLAGEGVLGSTASYAFTYTEALHDLFEEISGSHNPLHTNAEFAQERRFSERVGYGFLTASLLSAMVGEHIPRKLGLYGMCRGFSVDFRKPVYIGDKLTYTGTVTAVHKSVKQIDIDVAVTNQDAVVVATAKMRAGVFE